MKKHFTRIVALLVSLLILASTVLVALPASAAVTYRLGDASAPSPSYKSSRYYDYITSITLTGDDRTNVIAAALTQLGYQEGDSASQLGGTSGGSTNYTEYWRNMVGGTFAGGSPWAWCACFVSWSLYQGRATDQSNYSDLYRNHIGSTTYIWKEISCSQWVNGLSNAGYYKKSANRGGTYTPQYGDLIFFKNSKGPCHIGIVLYVKGGRVYTVEGNTSSGGFDANGGGVYFKNYSLTESRLHGYGVLPYKKNDASARIDYSGANPTTGLYMTYSLKYFYKDSSMSTRYSFDIPKYRMIECVEVVSNSVLKVKFDGTVGYISNNSDRVIQVTSTGKSGGAAVAGNLAAGATTTTFWTDDAGRQDVNVAVRGYSAKLTDSIASQLEPTYDANGNTGDWFAFFHNAEAADQNCDDGVGHIVLDLGSSQTVSSVLANISTVSGTAPASIEVFVGEDQWSLTSVGNMSFPSASYGWAGINFTATKARYIRLDVSMNAYWALINEIEVYANSQTKVPAGNASGNATVEEWAHDAIGATVKDEHNDVPLGGGGTPSSAGCVFGNAFTDGKITTAVTLTDGAWGAVQKYWNCGMTGEQIEAGEPCTGKFTLDLGKTLAIEAVKLHLANTQMAAPNGSINAPAPDAIKVTLLDENKAVVATGSITPKKDTEIVYWSDAYVANKAQARYVIVEITVGASGMYALFDEIAVFGAEVVEDNNIALNKTVVSSPAGVRDYTANLTDGVAEGECLPGVNNAEWYGLFTNADAADQNCPTGVGEIIIDLSKNYDLTEVKVNVAFTEGVYAPTSVVASVATSQDGKYTEIGELTGTFEGGSSYWVSVDATGAMGRYLKITVTVDTESEWSYWAMLNEVKAYGTENTDPVITRLRGDVNGDDVVDKKDYAALKRYCFETMTLDEVALLAADVNNDGVVDKKDYAALKRYCFNTWAIEVPYV